MSYDRLKLRKSINPMKKKNKLRIEEIIKKLKESKLKNIEMDKL